ncbi:hypothetical protein PMIN01_04834 [Paraphaeosphaeria minitans]|uniref:Uncharacterized protein n=1 Tax=Paraphaeosphaeria minitans TaxID=565426 RepID=A0A9P6GL88_9PLEO|nr:hypothetical protein PMIN01_04834 [Paraphaeosphaeria minitans]
MQPCSLAASPCSAALLREVFCPAQVVQHAAPRGAPSRARMPRNAPPVGVEDSGRLFPQAAWTRRSDGTVGPVLLSDQRELPPRRRVRQSSGRSAVQAPHIRRHDAQDAQEVDLPRPTLPMRPSASAVHPRERKAASARPETPISHAAIHIDGTCVAIVKRPGARLLQANPRLPVRLRRLNPAAHASRLFHRNTIVQLSPRGQTMYARDGAREKHKVRSVHFRRVASAQCQVTAHLRPGLTTTHDAHPEEMLSPAIRHGKQAENSSSEDGTVFACRDSPNLPIRLAWCSPPRTTISQYRLHIDTYLFMPGGTAAPGTPTNTSRQHLSRAGRWFLGVRRSTWVAARSWPAQRRRSV